MFHNLRYVFQPKGLGVHVVIPAPNFMGTKEQLLKQSIPDGEDFVELHPSELPGDNYFRDAWDLVNKKVTVNMEKAKQVHIGFLKGQREALLKTLDVQMHMALEKNDTEAQRVIANRKEKLRNMPSDPIFNSAMTPDQLKNIVPDYLKD